MEYQGLINTLKKALKLKGITYPKLAKMLDISEATIGRNFSEGNFSLKRFIKICSLIGVSIEDLIQMGEKEEPTIQITYTLEQEHLLAKNKNYLVFMDLLTLGNTPNQIAKDYGLDEGILIKILSGLEKVGLIEWLPGNKAKLTPPHILQFIRNGPCEKAYTRDYIYDFLEGSFEGENELVFMGWMQLSAQQQQKLLTSFKEQIREVKKDLKISHLLDVPKDPCGLVLAFKPWAPSGHLVFDKSKF